MKIAIISSIEERVPPAKYGGVELVVYNLVEQLVSLGNEVTLFASGDSKTRAELVPVFRQSIRSMSDAKDMRMREAYKYTGVGKMISHLAKRKFEIVHNHLGWRLLPFREFVDCPLVTTLHGPLDDQYLQKVYGEYKSANYVSISMAQRGSLPQLNFVANVYNGIDTSIFRFFPKPKGYFAFLGRMSPEKGPVQAIDIAKRAGVQLIMAAKVDVVDIDYFKKEVEPLIDGKQIKFIGEVDHAGKLELLGNAKALIAPIQWEEPFGLYFIEAMACGTPVITLRRGAAPEIIIDGKTGFVCRDLEEAILRIKQIDQIDRKDCFDHVRENFTAVKMAQEYLDVYRKLIKATK